MRYLLALALGTPVLFGATALSAQGPAEECDMQSFRVLTSRESAVGQRVTWIGLPEVACTDGVRIRADSAVVWEADERTEFFGGFRYSDAERELQANTADYYEREGSLFARGEAELRTLDGATIVRGDTLNLYEGAGGPAGDRLEVSGQRAFALIEPVDATDGGETEAPYEVLAERIRFEGERFFFAEGDVEVERDSLYAVARSLSFDRELGTLVLLEEARVESNGTETLGQRITLELPAGEITAMEVEDEASLLTGELDLSGARIEVEFEEGAVSYITTMEGEPSEDSGTPRRAAAFAEGLYLTGSTIEVNAPAGVLESVRAEGDARGESLGPDGVPPTDVEGDAERGGEDESTLEVSEETEAEPLPEERLEILDHDWIEGESVVGFFSTTEPPPGSREGPPVEEPEYVLTELMAEGNARTLYRSPPEEPGTAVADSVPPPVEMPPPDRSEWGVSYLVADQIRLFFTDGQVEELLAEGTVSGLQLEPEEVPAPTEEVDGPENPAEEPEAPRVEPGP